MKKTRTKLNKNNFIKSIGNMYLNGKGVDLYKTEKPNTFLLIGKNGWTKQWLKIDDEYIEGLYHTAMCYMTLDKYEREIEYTDIASLQLDAALHAIGWYELDHEDEYQQHLED